MKRGKKNAKHAGPTRRELRLERERDDAARKAKRASARARRAEAKLGELRSRRNPRRPPREWWNRCIAGVKLGGSAREPRAVCGAAWWAKPEHERAAIVRKLERGSRRDREAALALARAEQRHHARRGKRNPNAPKRPNRKRKNPREASLRENPKQLVSLVYRERKPDDDGRTHDYEHEFEGKLPALEESRGRLRIKGGSYKMRKGWIHG